MTTPFDLRFNILQMAENRLIQEYHAKIEQWHALKELGVYSNELKAEHALPKYPSKSEIFSLAFELKDFIDKK